MSSIQEKTIGFMGLGSIGFPICYGLVKSGWHIVLPSYRREMDQSMGFSPMAPDEETKSAMIDEMLAAGAASSNSQLELLEKSDIILTSLPSSVQVESIVLGEDGILNNSAPGTIFIDLSSSDPLSTQKLSSKLAKKRIQMLDAPISGGLSKAIKQTLTVMVGGDEALYNKCLPILETIGNPDNVIYVGPSGAGHTIKVANNYLSACCTAATTEALVLTTRAGIDPQKAIEVIASSGGRSDASMNKFPNLIFPGKDFNFTLDLMCKDVGIFNQVAKQMKLPAFISNLIYQVWTMPVAENGGNKDCLELIRLYERWGDVKLCGITEEDSIKTSPLQGAKSPDQIK